MKYPEDWRNKTIEQLEDQDLFSNPEFECFFISRTVSLMKTPLCDFTNEDLRILINQEIGLPFLSRLAIEKLKNNLFAEGDFEMGDLLISLLSLPAPHWKSNPKQWSELEAILNNKGSELHEMKISTDEFYKALD